MRFSLMTLILVLGNWIGAAYAADENACAKMKGPDRASCEKQHAKGHEKNQMRDKMRGQGAKDKARGAEKGNADHENHGAKSKAKP